MDLFSLNIATGGLPLYSLVSSRLAGTVITAPMDFVAFGFLIGAGGLNVADVSASHSVIHTIAALMLVLVLFTDAARVDLKQVRRDHNLPVRMLAAGLPVVANNTLPRPKHGRVRREPISCGTPASGRHTRHE